jgi:DNA-binding IclR family transcriptional regulator
MRRNREEARVSEVMTSAREADGSIRSVHRALQLLGKFGTERTTWGVSDLARETGLHKSVVARIMATMARNGFVVQDPVSRTYSVGPKAFAVGSAYMPQEILGTIARPIMQRLTEECGQANSVGVPAGERFIYLLVSDSRLPVRVAAHVGEERDYHANAIGKILLAGMTDEEVAEIIANGPLRAYTQHTITDPGRLMEEIGRIRLARMAENRQEAMIGVGARAVPIEDASGRWIAALSVVFPVHLVDESAVARMEELVTKAAREISAALSR